MQAPDFRDNPYQSPTQAELVEQEPKPPINSSLRAALLYCVKLGVVWAAIIVSFALAVDIISQATQSPNFTVGFTELIVITIPFAYFGVRRLLAATSI
jgi:hypothetical protein